MKKTILLLALAVLTAGGVFAQRVGDTYTLDGQPYTVESINGERVTLLKAQGVMTFTSISAFKTWLDAQPANTGASLPYNVKVNISDLGGASTTSGSLGNALRSNAYKYVNIDLSGSMFTSIEASAFANCVSLKSVTIGNRVTSIGNSAFQASPVTSVTFLGTIPSSGFSNTAFAGVGDLKAKFYEADKTNGTPGTYAKAGNVWTKQ
jgi:hypothetical protein